MPDITSVLNAVFVVLATLYICLQTALTIFEVRSAEHSANIVPVAFRERVSLAEHRKAVDYTGEVIQCDLVGALTGAGIALLLTFGNGFTVLLAGITTLFGTGYASHVVLALVITFVLAAVDVPLCWWKEFRINERYGFERTRPSKWLKRSIKESFVGWLLTVPFICAGIFICDSASYHWWVFALAVTVGFYVWRIVLSPQVVAFSPAVKPMPECELKDKLRELLIRLDHPQAEICTRSRPRSWRHGNAVLAGRFTRRRLVIFNHVLNRLEDEEILAIAACAIGRVNRFHNAARLLFFVTLTGFFWWGFATVAQKSFFYEALNINPALAVVNGSLNPGLLLCMLLTLVPVILYPVVFVIHLFTRLLDYDEDAYAVANVGAKPLVRAIVKLHRDYRNSLTPNLLYSIANHRRPHVVSRIQRALLADHREKQIRAAEAKGFNQDLAKYFNYVSQLKRNERDKRIRNRLIRKSESLREAENLRRRTFTM